MVIGMAIGAAVTFVSYAIVMKINDYLDYLAVQRAVEALINL
jgi:hypothetical protein